MRNWLRRSTHLFSVICVALLYTPDREHFGIVPLEVSSHPLLARISASSIREVTSSLFAGDGRGAACHRCGLWRSPRDRAAQSLGTALRSGALSPLCMLMLHSLIRFTVISPDA